MAGPASERRCGRLRRWWHARLRRYDREYLGRSFTERVWKVCDEETEEGDAFRHALWGTLWRIHICHWSGRGHWLCECGRHEDFPRLEL